MHFKTPPVKFSSTRRRLGYSHPAPTRFRVFVAAPHHSREFRELQAVPLLSFPLLFPASLPKDAVTLTVSLLAASSRINGSSISGKAAGECTKRPQPNVYTWIKSLYPLHFQPSLILSPSFSEVTAVHRQDRVSPPVHVVGCSTRCYPARKDARAGFPPLPLKASP